MIVQEHYGKLLDSDDFDIRFWQSQPVEIIFEAAYEMIRDYLLLKENYVDEPRLQRTIERFGKISHGHTKLTPKRLASHAFG